MDISNILFPVISLGGLGTMAGILLGYASKKYAVEEDPRVSQVRDVLPGANCGGCGYAGCDACAKAMVDGDAPPNACTIGGAAVAEAVGNILGVSVEAGERTAAFVKCSGDCHSTKDKYQYHGVMTCRDASLMPGGGYKACSYGCLGFADCVKVCQFGALSIVNGIAVVDEEKCTSCGLCVGACPKGLIDIISVSKKVRVACSSEDKGKDVKDACSVGCIGCTLCVKACEYGAMKFENNLATVDYDKCTQCNACAIKCPSKVITFAPGVNAGTAEEVAVG